MVAEQLTGKPDNEPRQQDKLKESPNKVSDTRFPKSSILAEQRAERVLEHKQGKTGMGKQETETVALGDVKWSDSEGSKPNKLRSTNKG